MTVTELQRVLIDLQTRLMQSQQQLEQWNVNSGDIPNPDADSAYVLANGMIANALENVKRLIIDLKV